MSNDDALRRDVQQTIINNPSVEKPAQGSDSYHDHLVKQNEHDRIRREQEQERSKQS